MIETESKFADKINTGGLQVYINHQLICQESVKNTFVCFNYAQYEKEGKSVQFCAKICPHVKKGLYSLWNAIIITLC